MMTTQAKQVGTEGTRAVGTTQPGGAPAPAVTIETRFGTFTFDDTNSVFLPKGVIGFPRHQRFGLVTIPDPRMAQFKLLQSLDEPQLSFLLMPVHLDGQTIAERDVDEACATLSIRREDAAFLVIVTLRKASEGITVSTNLRAPIVLDVEARIARQYVLPNPNYPIRHML